MDDARRESFSHTELSEVEAGREPALLPSFQGYHPVL